MKKDTTELVLRCPHCDDRVMIRTKTSVDDVLKRVENVVEIEAVDP